MNRELRNALLSWGIGVLAVFVVSQFLLHVTIPAGITRGQEREARSFGMIVFLIVSLMVFANIAYWTYRASQAPQPTVVAKPTLVTKSQSSSLIWPLVGLSIFGILRLAISIFILLLFYGVAVLIFRHAFGVKLPNPFGG